MKDFLLSYDTVCLRPKHSKLKSRNDADTTVLFLDKTFKLPVVPANMADVISIENACWLANNGYFYIMHRFNNVLPAFVSKANLDHLPFISISIGPADYKNYLQWAKVSGYRIDCITIDVAHAHHDNVKPIISYIREHFPKTKIIAGNVATADGVSYLGELGVDAIKVGIGGGSICTTRYMTGFHLPTLQSVYEANEVMALRAWNIPIIADGGAKHFGDIAKALTFGASMVMSGGWFAACIDSPAKIANGKKLYRGSTSFEMKGQHTHIEGRTLELEEGFTYSERMNQIRDAVTSQISYAGGTDLSAFDHVSWERILPFH